VTARVAGIFEHNQPLVQQQGKRALLKTTDALYSFLEEKQ
jgi:hypothetical protein